MTRVLFLLVPLVFIFGCDKIRALSQSDPPKQDTATATTDTADTESDETDKKSTDFKELTVIPPIQVHGSELEEVAAVLEAKRLRLEEQERDLVLREQMVTRLEAEALNQQADLERLRKETQTTLNDARSRIQKQYKTEYEKLLKQWDKIKEKHKEFIAKYLNKSESEEKNGLEPEIRRLRAEREQRVAQLLKTIEGMNAQACAMMITSMSTDDAVEVMSGLSNTKSAEIMSNMAPQKAAELARGLMGPKVPEVPSMDDVELPPSPDGDGPKDAKDARNTAETKK